MPRLNLPQKSSSQARSKARPTGPERSTAAVASAVADAKRLCVDLLQLRIQPAAGDAELRPRLHDAQAGGTYSRVQPLRLGHQLVEHRVVELAPPIVVAGLSATRRFFGQRAPRAAGPALQPGHLRCTEVRPECRAPAQQHHGRGHRHTHQPARGCHRRPRIQPAAVGPLCTGRRFRLGVGSHPAHEDLIAQRQQHRTDEQAEDAARGHAAERAEQDHRHRRIDAAAEHQRLEHVVGHAGDEQQHRVQRRLAGAVAAAHPEIGDRRQRDDQRRHLRDAEHEHHDRQHAGQRHAGDEQAQADKNGLDEGDADHALGDGADRRHRQHGELVAAFEAEDAREDRPAGAIAGLAEGHDDAGDDERRDEREDAAADAGHHRQRLLGQFTDLRLQALDQRRQVVVRLLPIGVDLRPDQRPFGDARLGRRNLQRVLLHFVDQPMHRVAHRIQQYRRGHDDQRDAEQGDQRRRPALPPAHPGGQRLVQRIQRDRQDQRPDHQHEEGREDPVAQHHQRQDQAGADQHIEQQPRAALLVCRIGWNGFA